MADAALSRWSGRPRLRCSTQWRPTIGKSTDIVEARRHVAVSVVQAIAQPRGLLGAQRGILLVLIVFIIVSVIGVTPLMLLVLLGGRPVGARTRILLAASLVLHVLDVLDVLLRYHNVALGLLGRASTFNCSEDLLVLN